jgi:Fe(3+) dicitrate transport protein
MAQGSQLDVRVPVALAVALACASVCFESRAQQVDEEIVVLGRLATVQPRDARELGGSIQFLAIAKLEAFSYNDVNRLLRQVSGLYLQEEEGSGLRPNIGIRGSGNDRNSKISVMEDGVLIAPAAYSAPAAYYFPRVTRMSGVEVVKGPASTKYGPLTTGGAINMFSTPIPGGSGEGIGGKLNLLGGEDGAMRTHGVVGGWIETDSAFDVGLMVEGVSEESDGFKHLDSGGDTGYDINDYLAKIAIRSNANAAVRQSLEIKLHSYDETSDETYLGLTLEDFRADPFLRYRGSQQDQMNVEHQTFQATHRIELGPTVDLTTLAYHTTTQRAWYKLNDVIDGGTLRGISAVLDDPDAFPEAMAALVGAPGYVSAANALRVRNNNREYYTTGVQMILGAQFEAAAARHDLEVSVRYHEDEEDRFQNDDRYQMSNGVMVLTAAGAPGSQVNRVVGAEALAFFARDTITRGSWTLVPGVRYETIDLARTDFALNDPGRNVPTVERNNEVDVWIPGFSATYRVTDTLRLFGGVHRGFSNPAPGSTADVETSWSYEAGVRVDRNAARLEAIAFFNDYDNLVGTCTASTGGGCNIGDQFDGGQVEVKGLELSAGYDVGASSEDGSLGVPISLVYTYTDAQFGSNFTSGYGPWGNVVSGDELPHMPEHQVTLNLGLDAAQWELNLGVNYVSKARATAGQGAILENQLVNERWLLDLSAAWNLNANLSLFANVQNLTDEVYNVAFSPAGARPGAPRNFLGGVKLRF